jgi:hypothetical protein
MCGPICDATTLLAHHDFACFPVILMLLHLDFHCLYVSVILFRLATQWNLVQVVLISVFSAGWIPATVVSVRLPLNELRKSKVYKVLSGVTVASMTLIDFYTPVQPLSRMPLHSRAKYFGLASVKVRFLFTVFITKGLQAISTRRCAKSLVPWFPLCCPIVLHFCANETAVGFEHR